jgi:hypothetical protein
MDESKKHVHALIAKAVDTRSADDAMKWTQAAANAATALDRLMSTCLR